MDMDGIAFQEWGDSATGTTLIVLPCSWHKTKYVPHLSHLLFLIIGQLIWKRLATKKLRQKLATGGAADGRDRERTALHDDRSPPLRFHLESCQSGHRRSGTACDIAPESFSTQVHLKE
jgi:hypothetical protein